MPPRIAGLVWCATFVVLDAAQAVVFGSLLQRQDSLLLGLMVFGLSAAACLAAVSWRAPGEIQTALANPRTLAALNLSSAVGWLAYLGAIQLIEPAVAFTLFSGVIPLTVAAAASIEMREVGPAPHGLETTGLALLSFGLLVLAASTLLGWSGFVRGGTGAALAGVLLAVLAGAAMAAMLLASDRLSRRGVSPAGVFGLRFPLYLLLAGTGYVMGIDDKGPIAPPDLAVAVALGLAVLAFPIYAVQKAISLTSALTVGAATALIPVAVLVMQTIEGRVGNSSATAVGLAIYTVGALAAVVGRVRTEARAAVQSAS